MTATVQALRITATKQRIECAQCARSIVAGQMVYMTDGRPLCGTCGHPDPAARIESFERASVVKRIRAALRRRSGKDWSVTGGKGTAYGWLRISVPKSREACAQNHVWDSETGTVCKDCQMHYLDVRRSVHEGCATHVCTDTCYRAYLSPEDRAELASLLGLERAHIQGVQVMPGHDSYVEYIDRAEGREPRAFGVRYWE